MAYLSVRFLPYEAMAKWALLSTLEQREERKVQANGQWVSWHTGTERFFVGPGGGLAKIIMRFTILHPRQNELRRRD
jgi:hypothetical protein